MTAPTALIWHERCMWHDTTRSAGPQADTMRWIEPGLPGEGPESRRRLKSLLDVSGLTEKMLCLPPVDVDDELALVHCGGYLDTVREVSEAGGGLVGPNAPIGPGGFEIALLAAGAAAAGVDAVLDGRARNAYSLARPAGHHAGRDRGQGNCVFNAVAVAATRSRTRWGADRVAIVDWDVHHGNGTESIFLDDPSTLTISLHQEDWYPRDSGGIDVRGAGEAEGSNINVPLPAGSGNGAYLEALTRIVRPALRRHRPDVILVACGLDANAMDPYGRMVVNSTGFADLTAHILDAADELCEGRVIFNHEGGYSPIYVPFCGLAVLEQLSGQVTGVVDPFLERYSGTFQDLTPDQESALARARQPHHEWGSRRG